MPTGAGRREKLHPVPAQDGRTSHGPHRLPRLDGPIGERIEAAVLAKHRRRLRRLGQGHALDPPGQEPWAVGEPGPRSGNRVEVLIDGARAFPEIAAAIQSAQRSVCIAGWHVDPAFELVREDPPVVLGELLAQTAKRIDVRVLVWAGAPVPAFHPTRREVSEAVATLLA
jgi:phosphatidylserine/phosphatidylglycerophosphate/cardiolipin synthase-like enzyme